MCGLSVERVGKISTYSYENRVQRQEMKRATQTKCGANNEEGSIMSTQLPVRANSMTLHGTEKSQKRLK